jgi:VanZ family protein
MLHAPHRRSLTLYFALTWSLLAIYASLYPFTGWRDSGIDVFVYLTAAWPRYTTSFDITTNAVAYFPFGMFWAAFISRRLPALPPLLAVLMVTGGTVVFSGGLETLQSYLPNRVPSNLDLLCNAGGACAGAWAGARWGRLLLDGGRLDRLRRRWIISGHGVEGGLLLLAFWLLIQCDPASLLFGAGDLRRLLGLPPAQPYSAELFRQIETLIAAAGTFSALLLASLLSASPRRRLFPLIVLAAAVLIRTLAQALMMQPAAAFAWATPGALSGLALGVALWLIAASLRLSLQRSLAGLALLAATVMVNLVPENPYLENTLQIWNSGQFLNFHGLTHFAASLWPFAVLPWLMLFYPEES